MTAPPTRRRRWLMLAVIMTAQTVANVGPIGVPAIAAVIRADLGLTLAQAGSFVSAYYVGPILMSLPAGKLSDQWGVARTFIFGQILIGLGLLAVSLSPSYPVLMVLMGAAGAGYGVLNPTSTKAAMEWSTPAQRATVVGLKQVGLPLGGAIGAALLPIVAVALGWRKAVATAGLLVLFVAVVTIFVYRDPLDRGDPVWPNARRNLHQVLVARDLWLVALATLVFAGMQAVWMAFLALYLREVGGLSLLGASRYLALAQVAGMVGRVAFGVLSDRALGGRRRLPLVVAGCGSALCSVGIALTGAGASMTWLVLLVGSAGFAGIGWNGVQHTLMAELAGPRAAGTALGLGLALASAGVTLAPPIFGWFVEWIGGYRGPWIGLALIMLAALTLLAPVRERPRFV